MHNDDYAYSPFASLLGGPYLGPISLISELRRLSPEMYMSETPLPCETFSTWLIENEILYTLFCIKDPMNSSTNIFVIYDQDSDSLFYLRRELWPCNIPTDTVVLAHFIWDDMGGGQRRPNFLLFDITYWDGKRLYGTDPRERYELLRQIQLRENALISLHFVGEKKALQSFLKDVECGKRSLPHKVKKVIYLTADPFKPLCE